MHKITQLKVLGEVEVLCKSAGCLPARFSDAHGSQPHRLATPRSVITISMRVMNISMLWVGNVRLLYLRL